MGDGTAGQSHDFFVSYVDADRDWAEWIGWELEQAGYRVLIQAWDSVPGTNWSEMIARSVLPGHRMIPVLSPQYLASAVAGAQWQAVWSADPAGTGRWLVPVLVERTEATGLLGARSWIDLTGVDADGARRLLLDGARAALVGRAKPTEPVPFPRRSSDSGGPAPRFPGELWQPAPPVPEVAFTPQRLTGDEVRRPALYDVLVQKLLPANGGRERVPGPIRPSRGGGGRRRHPYDDARRSGTTVGLVGAGGFGKTTLAALACQDHRVRDYYSDDVVWLTLGQHVRGAALTGRVNELVEQLTGRRPSFTEVEPAAQHLGKILDKGRRLLVLDDVWFLDQIEAFEVGGAECTRLVTTRVRDLLPAASVVAVDAMERHQALEVLGVGLPAAAESEWSGVLDLTGGWAVLLALVNRAVRRLVRYGADVGTAIATIESDLGRGGPTGLDVKNPTRRADAVAATMAASLNLLSRSDPTFVDRYRELAVFREDADIPLASLTRFWAATGQLPGPDVTQLCLELADLSLVSHLEIGERGVLRLHDVIRDYLRHQVGPGLRALHRALVDAHRPAVPVEDGRTAWWELTEGEYLFRHLPYHLDAAGVGESTELAELLGDLRWVAKKVRSAGSVNAQADLVLLPGDARAEGLRTLLRQTSHLYHRDDTLATTTAVLAAYAGGVDQLEARSRELYRRLTEPHLRPTRFPLSDHPSPALRQTLFGHESQVLHLVGAPDGSWLASADSAGAVRIWDVATGAETATPASHVGAVGALFVEPSGRWLASASRDGVRVWAPTTGAERWLPRRRTAAADTLASGQGGWLVTARRRRRDPRAHVWDPLTGARLATLRGHRGGLSHLLVASDGTWIATAGGRRGRTAAARLWNPISGARRAVLPGHAGGVTALAAPRDGTWIATAGADWHGAPVVRIWDVATGDERGRLAGHTNEVTALAVSGDDERLVSVSWESVRLWDPGTASELGCVFDHAAGADTVLAARRQSWLVTTSHSTMDPSVGLWDLKKPEAGPLLYDSWYDGSDVMMLAASPDDSWLATHSSTARVLRIWDTGSWTERSVLQAHTGQVTALHVAPDGSWLATASTDRTIRIWDTATPVGGGGWDARSSPVRTVVDDPAGGWVAALEPGGDVHVWDTASGKDLASFSGGIKAVTVAPDGSWLMLQPAAGSPPWQLWDTGTWTKRGDVDWLGRASNLRLLARHQNWIAFADWRGLGVWDIPRADRVLDVRWAPALSFGRNALDVGPVATAPDGSWLAGCLTAVESWCGTPRRVPRPR